MDRSIFGRSGPRQRIRGRDFAGTIDAVGPGVTGWQVGDTVLGEDDATLAEYAAVDQACLARKPDALSFEEAAAMPLAAVTADLCLRQGGVEAGQQVLIIGASGGVGTFAVQLAAARGAAVLQSAAPATSTWSPRLAPRRLSTTPATTSPLWGGRTTPCSTWSATGACGTCAASSPRAASWCCRAVETRARVSTSARSG